MRFILLNLVIAIVPSLLLLLYFYKKNIIKKEHPGLIWKTFAFGLIAVVPALAIEIIGGLFVEKIYGIFSVLVEAFIITALVEEVLKFLVIRIYLWNRSDFKKITDGIVYTIAASLGFAMLENLFYSFGSTLLLILRGLTAVPLHAISAGIMGYYIGLAKSKGSRKIGKGILYAVLFHGTYDFFLFTRTFTAVFVLPLLIAGWFILRSLYKKAIFIDLRNT